MAKYIKLLSGAKKECYSCSITNACILRFINTTVDSVKEFIGTEIIDYIDIVDENDKILESHDIYAKRKTVFAEDTTITEYETRVVKASYTETVEVEDPETGNKTTQEVFHPEEAERIEKKIPVEMITVILEKPDAKAEIDNIKQVVGIVNPNNMTLDEFKAYYKELIGKQCTAAIEGGVDVDTSLGKKHFSYTIEDQSNVKDLIMTAIFTDFTLPLPYHADGELCTLYQPSDIQKIYMLLCSNKTYHTTYCNVLNAMINEAKDLVSVKAITYGMEITDEKYIEVMSKINESKDALLTYVEKKFTANKSDELKEESNNE